MKEILLNLEPGRRLLLFLDYDGTLVPIQRRPDRAVLPVRRRRFLEGLSKKMFVCIVSGRSLSDVRRRVGLEGLAYIGNHGLEARWGRHAWVHPLAERRRPALGRLLKRIEIRARCFPRLLVEDKGLTGSIHFRRLDPALIAPLKRIVDEEVGRTAGIFVAAKGKRVFEIRPDIDWDKGAGIRKVMTWLPKGAGGLRIFIGDDRTDEDAFRVLGRDSITIRVGSGKKTRARHRLAGVDRVWEFLKICDGWSQEVNWDLQK
jgi:trehalose 6-phosphate phosphatase